MLIFQVDVSGSGVRVQGSRVQGSTALGLGFRINGLGLGVGGSGFGGSRFVVWGLGFAVWPIGVSGQLWSRANSVGPKSVESRSHMVSISDGNPGVCPHFMPCM